MNFNWEEYLRLAYSLANQQGSNIPPPGEEARLRASISRAYYACFITARNYLRDIRNVRVPKGGIHTFVINHYSTKFPGNMAASEIGTKLGRMRSNREKVDYEDSIGNMNLNTTSIFDLTYAARVINLVNGMPR